MKVKFKKLHPEAVIPTKAEDGSNGYDLVGVTERIDTEGRFVEYDTGIALELPKNFAALVLPRSSVTNKDIILGNGVGLIDASYRGSITFRFKNLIGGGVRKYKVGDRIGQLIVIHTNEIEFEEAQDLSETKRGTGSYGSTNKQEEEF